MEFDFSINLLFIDLITKVDNTLNIISNAPRDRSINLEPYRRNVSTAIDKMGQASSLAQNLPSVITSAKRLEYSDHRLYVLKDPECNDRKGALVGILKVGNKKLFIYDLQGNQHEMEPLCVLDFYVHESRQRQGCGKLLFDYMLRCENIQANHLAIDRPSPKFSAFLKKHYHLKDSIPQMNNFVVYNSFFRDRKDMTRRRNTRSAISISRQPLGLSSRMDKGFCALDTNTNRPIYTNSRNNNSHSDQKQQQSPIQPASNRDYLTATDLNSKTSIEKALEGISYRNQTRTENTSSKVPPVSKSKYNGGKTGPPHKDQRESSPPALRRDGPSNDFRDLYSQNSAQMISFNNNRPPRHELPSSISNSNMNRQPAISENPYTVNQKDVKDHQQVLNPPPSRPSTISAEADYTYNLGIRRHHSHTRLW